jgi:hypothetical protein
MLRISDISHGVFFVACADSLRIYATSVAFGDCSIRRNIVLVLGGLGVSVDLAIELSHYLSRSSSQKADSQIVVDCSELLLWTVRIKRFILLWCS